jgi:abequosyltransferase
MSSSNAILTIAIPTYNRAKFLFKNLSYLKTQYNSNFNILIQDNASTDNTRDIVKKFIQMDLPINYIRNKKNFGWAKNFELCYKNNKSSYLMILGDDDYILNGGVDIILDNLKNYKPSLLFLKAFSTKKNKNYKLKNKLGVILNKDDFLIATMLQFRLISSFVVNTKYVNKIKSFKGNFAHLHVVLTNLKYDNTFIFIKSKTIAVYPNNSDFNQKVNFSDIYVTEFFKLFRQYLKNKIRSEINEDLENKMLKDYYPKLILKSRLGLIKTDTKIKENFTYIFKSNLYFNKNKDLFIKNNLFSNVYLCFRLFKSLV